MKNFLAAGLTAIICCTSSAEDASTPPDISQTIANLKGDADVQNILDSFNSDIPTSTSPATFVLGAAGEQVPRYSSFREFAAGIGQGLDANGKILKSVSGEIAPFLAIGTITLQDQVNPIKRILSRTTFSVASTIGSDNDTKASYGLQSVLYSMEMDQALAAAGSQDCARAGDKLNETKPPPQHPPGGEFPPVVTIDEETQRLIDSCGKSIDNIVKRWNQTAIMIGFGQAFNTDNSEVSHLKQANKVVWVTASLGWDQNRKTKANGPSELGGLLTIHARTERDNEIVFSSDNSQHLENANIFGANLRYGTSRFAGLLEYSYRRGKVSGYETENRRRYLLGGEYRLMSDLYISLGIGTDTGSRDRKNQPFSLANLKWGFGTTPIIAR
jgi:hypothetical protein